MAKKIFLIIFAMIILCLGCGMCFAADNSVNLGNEVMQSIDKTGESMNNVVSGNWTNKDGKNMRTTEQKDVRNTNDYVRDNVRDDARAVRGTGTYNTTRTTAEQTATNAMNTMSTTTWMWIILVVAAIIIIAAIWYYATQNND